jgi:heterotetrameric sarcosine oxidase gamma subunit
VAETLIRSVSALDGAIAPGRHGRRMGDAGVIATEVGNVGLALVTARKGRRAALVDAVRAAFGVELPDTPRRIAGSDIAFIWSGPDQWLAHMQPAPAAGMEAVLAPLAGMAALVDQSNGRTVLRVTGPRVRDALAKGFPIDLHPRAFKTGYTAVTSVAHIGVQLWQIDDAPTYEIAVARGFALSFWHCLEASAAEYGLELVR